jgi:hypothetical protein
MALDRRGNPDFASCLSNELAATPARERRSMVIDDYAEAMALVERMKANLPIPARPTGQLATLLKQKKILLDADPQFEIKTVFYAGDEGGITCDVTPAGSKDAIVCSVTHLRIHPKHPLAQEIRAYQQTRTRRLARSGS